MRKLRRTPERAVLLEVPQGLLEERRRKGLDVWDEVWDGVLHMVPPPSGVHQRFAFRLGVALDPLARAKGPGHLPARERHPSRRRGQG